MAEKKKGEKPQMTIWEKKFATCMRVRGEEFLIYKELLQISICITVQFKRGTRYDKVIKI